MNYVMSLDILVLNMRVQKTNAKYPQHEPLAHGDFISESGSYTESSASIIQFDLA